MTIPFSGNGGVRAMKPGDFVATPFAGTQAGIQAALDYCSTPGGEVRLGPGNFTGITGLTMYNKTRLSGSGALTTLLTMAPSATGTALREKTVGEGNSNGAAGIIVEGIGIFGNGSTASGMDFGNQGGSAFTSNAFLSDVLVRDFTSGTAIKLNANAIHCRDVWVANNALGMWLLGGSSHYSGIWAEQHADACIRVASPWNTFVHVHLEDGGTLPSSSLLEVATGSNLFLGVQVQLGVNGISKLIREMSGVKGVQYLHVNVIDGGHTWTSTIYSENNAAAVTTNPYVPLMLDSHSGYFSYLRDTSTGGSIPIRGTGGLQTTWAGSMSSGSTITPDASSSYFSVTGNASVDNIGTAAAWTGREITIQTAAAPTFKHNSGGTGNIRCVGSADVVMTANDVIKFMYTGSVWVQCAPVVAI